MKLLLDENLSRRLVRRIEDLFPGSVHVSAEGLLQAHDDVIWQYGASSEGWHDQWVQVPPG